MLTKASASTPKVLWSFACLSVSLHTLTLENHILYKERNMCNNFIQRGNQVLLGRKERSPPKLTFIYYRAKKSTSEDGTQARLHQSRAIQSNLRVSADDFSEAFS